jgi:hypothetical protein
MTGKVTCFEKCKKRPKNEKKHGGRMARFMSKHRIWHFLLFCFEKYEIGSFWRKLKMPEENWKKRYFVPFNPIFDVASDGR